MNKNDYQEEFVVEPFLLKNRAMKKIPLLRTTMPSEGVMLQFYTLFSVLLYIHISPFPFLTLLNQFPWFQDMSHLSMTRFTYL
jgi:hypothetical protein